MFGSIFPFLYVLVVIGLLWKAFQVMAKGFFAFQEFDNQQIPLKKDRTGQFTIHPELLNEQGKITDEELLTVRFSNDLDPPKPTQPSSE
ncbi:hypothetical protein EV06_0693 [Prochlorococcus sp. MIT 0602]|nr:MULTISPECIES: DUF2973 domain-containing protein [unclassified Prochlorococcus]KGG16849.1 hypothetical protein EV06_0693 [Prochlorococcus sp. MIT 0602]KGG18177.1 hypothetical protein EV07_0091 [Prochlorococcus sp. MIT 0603]